MKMNLPKVNNFNSAFQQLVVGITSATLTLSGPWDIGNMPFTVGNIFTFVLQATVVGPVTLTVNAIVNDITPESDIDGALTVKVTAETTGSFTAAIA